jgi:hypothetical protein
MEVVLRIESYIQNQLDETHRLVTFGKLKKNHPANRKAGLGPRRPFSKLSILFEAACGEISAKDLKKKKKRSCTKNMGDQSQSYIYSGPLILLFVSN